MAGNISTAAQLDALAIDPLQAQGAVATFDGHAIGNVANNIDGSGWKAYVAAGDLNMNWNFAQRAGDLTISKFDTSMTPEGLTFSGQMSAPGVANGNHFSGTLSGRLPSNLDLNSLSGGAAARSSTTETPWLPASSATGTWAIPPTGRPAFSPVAFCSGCTLAATAHR